MASARAFCLGLAIILGGRAAHAEPSPSPSPAASLDFNLLPEAPKMTPADLARLERLDRDVRRRRKLLTAHQAAGFATLALLALTLVLGQLNFQDKYGGGGDTGLYQPYHLGLGITTTVAFTTTGILALAAPNPYPKPTRLDAALVHKLAMALATGGIVAQLILGPVTASREGRLDQRDWALAHLVTGYTTFAFTAAGTLAFVFK
jgi:hypothetical protein